MKKRAEDLTKELDESDKEYQEKAVQTRRNAYAKAAAGEAESGLKQLATKISHSEKELKEKKAHLVSKRDEATSAENELKARTKDLEAIKASMGSINYEDGQMEALQKDRSIELEVLQKLKDKVRTLSGELANVHFSYREPIKNFDRSKVKGVVARLIKIKDRSIILIHVIQYQNYTSHTFSEMLLQNSYNLLCQNFDSGLAECCHHERISLLVYSPLAMGIFSGKYHSSDDGGPRGIIKTVPKKSDTWALYQN